MKKLILYVILLMLLCALSASAQQNFEKDVIKTSGGDLIVTFIGHGSLMLKYKNQNIYIDPFSRVADYSKLPKAEIVFLTHNHGDHLDLNALNPIRTDKTKIVLTEKCAEKIDHGIIMKNGGGGPGSTVADLKVLKPR